MQIVSASAVEMFCDALATRSPNATPTGRRLSTGGLPTCPWPAATNPAATTQRKAGAKQQAQRRRRRCGNASSPEPSAIPAHLPPVLRSGFSTRAAATRTPRGCARWHPTARHLHRFAMRTSRARRLPQSATNQPSETRPPTSPAHVQPTPRLAISILPAATRTPRGPALPAATPAPRASPGSHRAKLRRCRPARRSNRVKRRKARGFAPWTPPRAAALGTLHLDRRWEGSRWRQPSHRRSPARRSPPPTPSHLRSKRMDSKGSAVITIYLIDVSMDFQYFCYTTHAYTHAPNRTVLILQQQSGTTGLLGHPPKIPRPSVNRSRGPVPSPRTDT